MVVTSMLMGMGYVVSKRAAGKSFKIRHFRTLTVLIVLAVALIVLFQVYYVLAFQTTEDVVRMLLSMFFPVFIHVLGRGVFAIAHRFFDTTASYGADALQFGVELVGELHVLLAFPTLEPGLTILFLLADTLFVAYTLFTFTAWFHRRVTSWKVTSKIYSKELDRYRAHKARHEFVAILAHLVAAGATLVYFPFMYYGYTAAYYRWVDEYTRDDVNRVLIFYAIFIAGEVRYIRIGLLHANAVSACGSLPVASPSSPVIQPRWPVRRNNSTTQHVVSGTRSCIGGMASCSCWTSTNTITTPASV